jgi:hypothetical protein
LDRRNQGFLEIDMTDPIVPGRSCGTCALCCRVMEIREIAKPQGVWCPNCKPGVGCKIYHGRPTECGNFYCGYLTMPKLGDEWKPERSRIVITLEQGGRRLAAHVDLTRPDAWRSEPYYSRLKQWAIAGLQKDRLVVVRLGERMFVILPDRDVDLGIMTEEDRILTRRLETPKGPRWEAFKAGQEPAGFGSRV